MSPSSRSERGRTTTSVGRGAKRAGRGRGAASTTGGRPRRVGVLWRLRRVLFLVLLLGIAAASGLVYVLWQVPLPSEAPPLTQTTFICASNVTSACTADNSIAQLSGGVDRVQVTYEQVPPVMVVALLSAEDRDFFRHSGVDPVAVGRALVSDLRNDTLRQGGSTITQQYVKNAYLTADRTWERKVKEAVLSVKLEREVPKQEILERYLNIIYWGRGAYGIEAASRVYFGKHVEELTLPEAAYLAGIIRAPEAADANRQPGDPLRDEQREAATIRRAAVLDAMVEEGYISADQAAQVDQMSWDYVLPRTEAEDYGRIARPDLGTEYFVDHVRRWLVDSGNFTDAQVYGGGLRVYTTLDFEAQEAAYDAIESNLGWDGDPDASLVTIDERGYVRAMVGGTDFETSQVNLATGKLGGGSGRQPGSSFKPVVLAEALRQGIPLETTYNSPSKILIPDANAGEDWEPANYADAGQGVLNLVDATRVSSNTAYAQLMMEVGPEPVAALGERLGITTPIRPYPSVVLGTEEVSVLDMASTYSTFANHGVHLGPWVVTRVTDAEGTVLWEVPGDGEQVLSAEIADTVSWVLHQVVESGTGKAAQLPDEEVAGKTGTTDDYRDAWFVGYTCSRLTTAVWVGYGGTETKYMTSVHGRKVAGGTFPAEIWHDYMVDAPFGADPECDFERPDTVSARLERPSGTAPRSSGTAVPATTTTTGQASTSTTEAETSTTSTTTDPSSTSSSTTAAPTTTSTTAAPTTTSTTAAPTTTSTTAAPP